MTLYLAYGSNLNFNQMAYRCPTAKLVAKTELKDYELLFRGGHGSAVATVEPKEGSTVPCVVWEIGKHDEAVLDRYEGWPNLYRKENVKVKIGKQEKKVMVYIMNVNECRPINLPSRYYYNAIKEGYGDCDLDISFLEAALKRSQN